MNESPRPDQRRRDDLLEALYWLKGEGLEARTAPATLAALVGGGDEAALQADLAALDALGWIEVAADGSCALTEEGHREAGRRFAESFSDVLGRQGHGLCDDDCDCHVSGEHHAACQHDRAHHTH